LITATGIEPLHAMARGLRAGVIASGEAVGGIVAAKSRSTHMLEIMGKIPLRFARKQPVVVLTLGYTRHTAAEH
jgi:hypothetical protein